MQRRRGRRLTINQGRPDSDVAGHAGVVEDSEDGRAAQHQASLRRDRGALQGPEALRGLAAESTQPSAYGNQIAAAHAGLQANLPDPATLVRRVQDLRIVQAASRSSMEQDTKGL